MEHSSAKSTPESLLKTAKGDIVNMRKYMGELADQLGINIVMDVSSGKQLCIMIKLIVTRQTSPTSHQNLNPDLSY